MNEKRKQQRIETRKNEMCTWKESKSFWKISIQLHNSVSISENLDYAYAFVSITPLPEVAFQNLWSSFHFKHIQWFDMCCEFFLSINLFKTDANLLRCQIYFLLYWECCYAYKLAIFQVPLMVKFSMSLSFFCLRQIQQV